MKYFYLFFAIAGFLFVPSSGYSETALPGDVKEIVTQITSSVVGGSVRRAEENDSLMIPYVDDVRLSSPRTAVSSLRRYFPLNNNDVKYFQGLILGTTYDAVYHYSQVNYNGRSCYLEEDSLDGSMTYYGYSGDDLQLYGATLGSENYPLSTPLTILNDSLLTNGGTLQSSSTFTVGAFNVTLDLTVVSIPIELETISLGTVENCRSIEMTFSISILGDLETLDMKEVWVLAPDIGKLRVAVVDESLSLRGWLTLIDGTVGGDLVSDIINPVDEEVPYVEGEYNYYLPFYLSSVGTQWTGLGLANGNPEEPAQLRVTVYDSDGGLLATENKTIPAYGQDAFIVATHLNNSGWMQVNSHQPMSGLAFLGSWNVPLLMADIPFVSELSSCLVIPHIAQDGTWDTTVLICNPNNETASVELKYVDKEGVVQGTQNFTISALGSGEYPLSTVFNDKIPLSGRVEINSTQGIAVFALYSDQKNGGTYYAGINAENCE